MKGILTNKTYIYNTRICIHGNFMSLAYNHFPLCLVFAYPPIVRIPEFQKKNEWCHGRGKSDEAIGRIRLCVFLTFWFLYLFVKIQFKKYSTNKTEYLCYIVAFLYDLYIFELQKLAITSKLSKWLEPSLGI